MIDFTYSADVLNPDGKVKLITSLELYAQVPDSTGKYYSVPVGMAQQFDVSEQRTITYNFVIGNKNPSRCRDLIPCPVSQSTITLHMVSMYQVNGIGLLSTPNPTATAFKPALPQNVRPFNLVERWLNPSTGNTLYEIVYTGCYIASCSTPKTMNQNEIRVIENMNIHFKDIQLTPGMLDQDVSGGTLGNPFNVKI
jgi:hypothetical protein